MAERAASWGVRGSGEGKRGGGSGGCETKRRMRRSRGSSSSWEHLESELEE